MRVAFGQWLLGFPLLGDVAVLIALYTVAAHQSRTRALLAAGLAEAGAIMAALKWDPAGTPQRSLLFLTATVVAALFAGLATASGSRYLAWMDERARRLEVERDQQAEIAAAAERTRIARELHDIVSHSLSVVITLADAAAIVGRGDPDRGVEAMTEVSEVGRQALADMRAMLGVLRTDETSVRAGPAARYRRARRARRPRPGHRAVCRSRHRGHGLPARRGGRADRLPHRPGGADQYDPARRAPARAGHAQLSRSRGPGHGSPTTAPAPAPGHRRGRAGHGLDGMRERVALHGGVLRAGPDPAGGWLVDATFRPGAGTHLISVLLADDQPLLRRGFRMILEAEGDITVVAEAGGGAEAIELARQHAPDVVLMDIRMPGTDGIEATRQITAADARVRVLVLTTFDLDEYAFGALRSGASGFLLKDVRPGDLVAAIRTVAAGDAVISPRVTRRLLEEYAQVLPLPAGQQAQRYPQLDALTEREREVLIAVARGLSNTEIAAALYVSEATVKSHVGRILAKLGLRDRVQVVVLAYEAGLIQPGCASSWPSSCQRRRERRRRESNPCTGLCRPLPKPLGHSATKGMPQGHTDPRERTTGFEPATLTLAR